MLERALERKDQGSPMLKPMIRTIDRWQFELPLALILGAAVAFATIAAPPQLFGAPYGIAVPTGVALVRCAAAGLFALLAGVIAFFAMRRPRLREIVITDDQQEPETPSMVAERLVRLRRADAHPDAPPRQPIRASRDLGEPFMDVAGFAPPPPPLVDLVVPSALPIPDAEYVEVESTSIDNAAEIEEPAVETSVEAEPATAAEPAAEACAADQGFAVEPLNSASPTPVIDALPDAVPAEDASPIEAFKPDIEPVPAPSRPSRQSLSSMMERLTAGLERRSGEPLPPPPAVDALAEALSGPRDVGPALRGALSQLNRLAIRRP